MSCFRGRSPGGRGYELFPGGEVPAGVVKGFVGCGPRNPLLRPRAVACRADLSLFWALAQESLPRAHRGGRAVTLRSPGGPWPTKAFPAPTRSCLPGGFKLVLGCGPGKCSPRPRRWARRDAAAAGWALAHESPSRAHAQLPPGRNQACSGPWPRKVFPAPTKVGAP